MKNFKNSKTAKLVSGFVGLSMAAMMVPGIASAATVEELTAQINALLAQVSALQSAQGNSTATPAACAYTFAQTLKVGVTSDEVMNLQKVLNMSADTQVSASGVGSKGMETKYFGAMTKAAVIKFQEKYAADVLTPVGLTKGTGLVGAATRAKLNTMCATTPTTPTTPTTGSTTVSSSVSATLDASSPAAGSVIKGASTKVAIFKLTNNGSAAAKVTAIKMKRTGVSSDSTLNNVYLYNGDSRLTDAASVATGIINFSDTAGLVTIPANSSVMLGVMVEVSNASTVNNGETVGVMLTDVVADGVAVAGLPISGAQQTVVGQPDGMSVVSFNGTTLPSSASNVDPQVDYVVWQNTINVQSRDALLSSIRFRQLGSVASTDLKNYRLMIDGVQVGSAVESVNSNQYVEFTFTSPVTLKAGSRIVKLVADIVGGSNKTFAFSVQQAVDAMFTDSQLSVVVAPKVGSNTFSAVTSQTQTVNQGTLTITKSTDSPSGNVVLQGTGLTLAKFTLKAAGEKLKIENLQVAFAYSSTTGTAAKIRNGAIFANGVQIGSTAGIAEDSVTPTQFNLGSSLIVEPGKDVALEIRGDIANGGSNGEFAAGETLIAKIMTGTNNVYKMSSYGYIGNSSVSGNTLTVATGNMTVAKATAYASQTVVVPQTAFKIAEFNVTTGSTEALNLNQFTLAFTGANYTASQLQDVYVVYGTKQTTVKSSVASSSNTFSINENVAANTTVPVKVYATLNAGIANAATITTSVTVDATSQSSGNAATGNATGQTITVGTGSLTVATDASTPVSAIVVGGTMPLVGAYKFTASNDAFTVVDISATTTNSSAIVELVFKDGSTELGRQPFNGTSLTKAGLNVAIPANTSKVISVYANLGSVGTNAGTSGSNIRVTLTSVKYRDSNGVETTDSYAAGVMGNSMYVYKTKPTITNVALPTSVLNAGTQTVAQFTVTADAAGTVAWRQIKLNIASSAPSSFVTTSGYAIYDAANQSTSLTGITVTQTASSVTFTSSVDQEVSGSKTYVVKALVGGNVVTGSSLSHSIPTVATAQTAPVAYASVSSSSSFIWSDEALTPHSATSDDWSDDFLVKNLPTDSQTMSK